MPLKGGQDLRESISTLRANGPAALGASLYEEGIEIIGESDKNVPYEWGNLRRSHYVELPKMGPSGPSVEEGYGAGYGLFVHEIPANHPKGGKDHFLRDAVDKRSVGMSERLARRMESHLAHGTGIVPLGIPSTKPDPMVAIRAGEAARKRASAKRRKKKGGRR